MADEKLKFNYWVVFSFVTPDDHLRLTGRFLERSGPIETHEDIKGLVAEAGFADLRALQPIDWKRME